MANDKLTDSWLSKPKVSCDMQVLIHGVPFSLNKELLISKSAKIAALLTAHSEEDLSQFLRNISVNPRTFELVARFCHGFELQMSSENVIPLACLAYYLGMNETHSKDNLLKKALTFFEQKVLLSWNKTIQAFRTAENIEKQAVQLGLIDACIDSIVEKALVDPRILGEPMKNLEGDDAFEDNEIVYGPNARQKLFAPDWKSEDLTTLPLQLYEPTVEAMIQWGVPLEYVAATLCKYAEDQVLSGGRRGKMSGKQVIEIIERLMPHEKGLFPCTLLFEMLRFSIISEANIECRNGFELRIGKQLDQATVHDLLIRTQGYAKELQYDIESVKRILQNFYGNYNSSNISGVIAVAELTEEFLAEIASDRDLETSTFISLAEMSVAASIGTERTSDGIYKAIDIYLDKHRYLTDSEREKVCRVLDCQKLSAKACDHAAKNERLPLRIVIHVLFVAQLQLRDSIMEVQDNGRETMNEEDLEKDEENLLLMNEGGVRSEMEEMGNKVMELERDCYMMRREIEGRCDCRHHNKVKKGKGGSVWKQMKRKLGCIGNGINNCNCQVKKVKVHTKSDP